MARCPASTSENTKAKAVRLVREHTDDYDSKWAALREISSRLGMSAETLRKWLRQAEVDPVETPGVTSAAAREIRELRRKNKELAARIEILKAATSFVVWSATPLHPLICAFIDENRDRFGVLPICRALQVHGVQIAPRTCWAHRSAAPSKRELRDTTITEILAGVYEADAAGKRPPNRYTAA